MIIQCPSCKAQANLPDSKEGAKVRCSSSSKVYVARPKGARARGGKQADNSNVMVGGIVVAVLLVLGLIISSGSGPDAPPPPPPEEPEPEPVEVVDLMGWESEGVQAVRQIHNLILAGDDFRLGQRIHAERAYARIGEELAAAAAEAGEPAPERTPWNQLPTTDRLIFASDLAKDMLSGSGKDLLAGWKPYHGWVESDDEGVGGGLLVRVQVAFEDASAGQADRHVEWHLWRENGTLKAWDWKRWISPDEKIQQRRTKKVEKKTLSDGSVVLEGRIRPIPYDDDVPADLRKRIDGLVAKLVDPDATKTFSIQQELKEIGKPAIAPLLTQLATIPLDSLENASALNLVHLTLRDITGYQSLFQAHEAMGTTKERQDAGLKQWFGWYDRRYRRFEGRKDTADDPFLDDPDFKPRNERERRDFERARQGGGR